MRDHVLALLSISSAARFAETSKGFTGRGSVMARHLLVVRCVGFGRSLFEQIQQVVSFPPYVLGGIDEATDIDKQHNLCVANLVIALGKFVTHGQSPLLEVFALSRWRKLARK